MPEPDSSGRKVRARGKPGGKTEASSSLSGATAPSECGLKFCAITPFIIIKTEKGVLGKGHSPGSVTVSLGQTFEVGWCHLVSTHGKRSL